MNDNNESITPESLQARAEYLARTCDGGNVFRGELEELARDMNALSHADLPEDDQDRMK